MQQRRSDVIHLHLQLDVNFLSVSSSVVGNFAWTPEIIYRRAQKHIAHKQKHIAHKNTLLLCDSAAATQKQSPS